MSIPIDQVVDGLRGCGIEKSTYDAGTGRHKSECPSCRTRGALSFCEDAFGSTSLQCDTDECTPDTIATAIRVGLKTLRTAAEDPLAYVREQLDEPGLQRIVKHGKSGDTYVLHFSDGRDVNLGNAAAVLSQSKFWAAYYAHRDEHPFKFRPKDGAWLRFTRCIAHAAEERDTVSSEAEETLGWLAGYVGRRVVVDMADTSALFEMLERRTPFTDTVERLHVNLNDFAARLARDAQVRVSTRELSARLAALGFTKAMPSARSGGEVRKARYWASPPGFEVDA